MGALVKGRKSLFWPIKLSTCLRAAELRLSCVEVSKLFQETSNFKRQTSPRIRGIYVAIATWSSSQLPLLLYYPLLTPRRKERKNTLIIRSAGQRNVRETADWADKDNRRPLKCQRRQPLLTFYTPVPNNNRYSWLSLRNIYEPISYWPLTSLVLKFSCKWHMDKEKFITIMAIAKNLWQ